MNKEYLIIGVSIIILIVVVLVFKFRKNDKGLDESQKSEIVTFLGGSSNIVNFEAKVSRLNVYVNDTSVVRVEDIKAITNCGVSVVNNKVQLILKDDAVSMENILNDLKMRD